MNQGDFTQIRPNSASGNILDIRIVNLCYLARGVAEHRFVTVVDAVVIL